MNWDHLYENEEYTFDNFVELKATVVHGFKRGSKELGIPTANLSMEELGEKGESLNTGIYYGWATVKNQDYCAVVSVGWNPYYKNTKKTVEAHLLQQLEDFYDETIVVNLCGFLRKECNFNSLGKYYFILVNRRKCLSTATPSYYSKLFC